MELTLEHLTKRYGETVALHDVTITLTSGIYGLLGANGAGKSTLMNLITDIESIADQVLLLKQGMLLRVDTPQNLIAAVPAEWKPVMGVLSLEDVYLYFLGE